MVVGCINGVFFKENVWVFCWDIKIESCNNEVIIRWRFIVVIKW